MAAPMPVQMIPITRQTILIGTVWASGRKLSRAFFGGTGGLFVMETAGSGDILINSFVSLIIIDVTYDNPITVDNEQVVAWAALSWYIPKGN